MPARTNPADSDAVPALSAASASKKVVGDVVVALAEPSGVVLTGGLLRALASHAADVIVESV